MLKVQGQEKIWPSVVIGRRSQRYADGVRNESTGARGQDRRRWFPGSDLSFRPVQPVGRGRLAQARARSRSIWPPVMKRKGIAFDASGAKRVRPEENRVELEDGTSLDYDYLVIATGPDLAFDEIEGLGPERPHPVDLSRRSRRRKPSERSKRSAANPGPIVVGAVQGASCFGPAYEFAVHPRYRAAPAQAARPRADDVRDAGALYRPSRSRRRRRHQGPARKRDARPAHQVDHQCARRRRSSRAR